MSFAPHPLAVRVATVADAARVAELARRTFVETFGAQNSAANMAAYVAATFGERLQAAELQDPRLITLLGDLEGVPVAYAQLRAGDAPACVTGIAPIELARFYVDSSWHGRGVAAQLMHAVVGTAAAQGARTLWLGVWEHNHRAIAFYRRHGFHDVGAHPFVLGDDVQTDRLMQRPVAGER